MPKQNNINTSVKSFNFKGPVQQMILNLIISTAIMGLVVYLTNHKLSKDLNEVKDRVLYLENHPVESLPGPRGLTGKQGPRGYKGETGEPGLQGPQGQRGLQGITGKAGDIGFRGPKGDKGDQGPVGKMGMKGEPGVRGEIGKTGERGRTGPTGREGVSMLQLTDLETKVSKLMLAQPNPIQ